MKTFEVNTPALKIVTEALTGVITSRQNGTMEKDEARDIVAAGNGVTRAIGQELQVRLAMPRLAAMEARMIDADASDQKQIKAA